MATISDRNTPFPDIPTFTIGTPYDKSALTTCLPVNTPIVGIGSIIKPSLQEQMATAAVKKDDGKPDWSLVPFEGLEGMVRVLEFGAKKYSRNNWMTAGGFSYRRVITACLRHLFAYMRGEDNDPESGLSHISHAQCNLLFIGYYLTNKEKFNKDDREL